MNYKELLLNKFLVKYNFNLVNFNRLYKYWGLKYYTSEGHLEIFLEQYSLNGNLTLRCYCSDETTTNLNLDMKIETLEENLKDFIQTIKEVKIK